MQRHGVNGVKSSRARVDSRCPPWCWSWSTPARRPCPVVLCRTDSKPAGCPGRRNTLRRSFPTARRGFILPLPVCWSPHSAASPLTHTVRKHKGEIGASYQRGEEEPLRLQREAPNKLPRGSRVLAHAGHRRQSESAAPGSAPARRRRSRRDRNSQRCQTRSEHSRPDPSTRLSAPTLARLFSPLRKGPSSPRLDPHPRYLAGWHMTLHPVPGTGRERGPGAASSLPGCPGRPRPRPRPRPQPRRPHAAAQSAPPRRRDKAGPGAGTYLGAERRPGRRECGGRGRTGRRRARSPAAMGGCRRRLVARRRRGARRAAAGAVTGRERRGGRAGPAAAGRVAARGRERRDCGAAEGGQ